MKTLIIIASLLTTLGATISTAQAATCGGAFTVREVTPSEGFECLVWTAGSGTACGDGDLSSDWSEISRMDFVNSCDAQIELLAGARILTYDSVTNDEIIRTTLDAGERTENLDLRDYNRDDTLEDADTFTHVVQVQRGDLVGTLTITIDYEREPSALGCACSAAPTPRPDASTLLVLMGVGLLWQRNRSRLTR